MDFDQICVKLTYSLNSLCKGTKQVGHSVPQNSCSYFSMKTFVVTPHHNCLNETVLVTGHKICFYGEMWIIIPKLFQLPLLIWSTILFVAVLWIESLMLEAVRMVVEGTRPGPLLITSPSDLTPRGPCQHISTLR